PIQGRTSTGTEVHFSFVDPAGTLNRPRQTAVTARLLCHDGPLPARLPFGDPTGDFELPGGGPIRRIVALVKPTEPIEPALGTSRLWRLISQLSLNYASLVSDGPEALQELLRLHNFGDTSSGEAQIRGITGVRGMPTHAR